MKYYTPAQVAEICGVNRLTVYRWIEAGKIEAKTMGFQQRKYIAEVDVPTFIRKNRS